MTPVRVHSWYALAAVTQVPIEASTADTELAIHRTVYFWAACTYHEVLLAEMRGGDFDVGRRTYGMLRRAGLEAVQIRAAVRALGPGHPYRRLPIQFAISLRQRILQVVDEAELDELVADCERIAADPDTYMATFIVTQVWGRVPS